MNVKHVACSLVTLLLAVSGPSLADKGKDGVGKGRGEVHQRHAASRQHHGRSYFHEHSYTRLDIPKGHYPPPGECRVWYPERPPGHQPPPVKCHRASVPRGAWLIRHPADRPEHVHVVVYEPERPGKVLVVGEFEIGSGVFVRVVLQ